VFCRSDGLAPKPGVFGDSGVSHRLHRADSQQLASVVECTCRHDWD
jgi:hypothetical protein